MCQKIAADRNQGRQNWDLPMEGKVDRMRGNVFQLGQGRFKLDVEKKFTIERMIKH